MTDDPGPDGAGAPPAPHAAPGPDLTGTLIDDETADGLPGRPPGREGPAADDRPGDGAGPPGTTAGGPLPEREPGTPIGRRAFVGLVGLGLTSLVWGNQLLDLVAKSTTLLPEKVRSVVPFGEGWRIYAVDPPFPRFDPATWRLTIEGMVTTPLELTYDDLLKLPAAEQVTDFHCVTGWSVPKVPWKGVRIHDLLAAAGPSAEATGLEFWSMEQDYVDTLTKEQALAADVMVAYEMGGKPITREHGAPTRVVIPQMYGYKGVKWLHKIVVTDKLDPGYWEVRGYDVDAYIGKSNGFFR
ncbi:MAG: molybdopterin-dependent oxidoreductase [Solirubrobacteraceae bacterium]|nr:molybdopterin-dependent oxidoreductase [Patulibacter sp.]